MKCQAIKFVHADLVGLGCSISILGFCMIATATEGRKVICDIFDVLFRQLEGLMLHDGMGAFRFSRVNLIAHGARAEQLNLRD